MFKNVQYRDGKSTKLVAQYNIISLQLMIIVQIKSVQDEIVSIITIKEHLMLSLKGNTEYSIKCDTIILTTLNRVTNLKNYQLKNSTLVCSASV